MTETPNTIKMSREEAIKQYGLSYVLMLVKPADGGITQLVAHEMLGGKGGPRFVAGYDELVKLPETVTLPADVEIGQQVYILRVKRNEDGSAVKDDQGQTVWEQVTDEVTDVFHIDADPRHQTNPTAYPATHTIMWKTQTGTKFQTPLPEDPQTWNTQFVFTSAEALKAFVEKVQGAENALLRDMHSQFDRAVKAAANDDRKAPPQAEAAAAAAGSPLTAAP